jgi:hypothetical protein
VRKIFAPLWIHARAVSLRGLAMAQYCRAAWQAWGATLLIDATIGKILESIRELGLTFYTVETTLPLHL